MGDNLAARCFRACCWAGLGSMGTQGIRMVRMLVLTYILMPDDIGVMILVWYVLGLLQELSDVGTKHAIIQNPRGLENDYLNSGWIMNLVRCTGLIVILYLTAPLIARGIYQEEQLSGLLRLSCLILVFDGLGSMSMVALRKELKQGLISFVTLVGQVVGTAAAIYFAVKMRNAQGVVIGEICGAGALCVMSYLVHPFRPRLKWNGRATSQLIGYGLVVYIVSLIDAFGTRLDVFILGRIAGLSDVGIYGPAMQIILAPCAIFSLLTISVGFPALSMLQNDIGAVRKGTAEIVKATQMLSIPAFGLLAILGPDVVRVLPEKFAEVGPAIRILSLTGFLMVFMRQLTPALYAIKKVYWFIIRGLLQIVIILVIMVPFYRRWGIYGICWAINIAYIVTVAFVLVVALRDLRWSVWGFLADTAGPHRAGAIGAVCVGGIYVVLLVFDVKDGGGLWGRMIMVAAGLLGFGLSSWGDFRQGGKFQ
ncbi:MAG: oligosaccharide flippase family protein [Planctomycetes bacterium]|nr:oligosaccharide flippase family protein [Planctomycetota bacterium]